MSTKFYTSLIFFFIVNIAISQESHLYENSKKISYILKFSELDFDTYSQKDLIKFKNAPSFDLGIEYRLLTKQKFQIATGATLSYSTIEYNLDGNLANSGTELFLNLPLTFEYNVKIGESFYVTPGLGFKINSFLNSEMRDYQNYSTSHLYETSLQTKPYSFSALGQVDFNYKSNSGIWGLHVSYNKGITNTYSMNIMENNSYILSNSIKRDFFTIGLKFTPNK